MTGGGRTDWRAFGREQAEQLMRTRTPLEAVGLIVIIMTEGGKIPAQQLGAVAAGAVEAYRAAEAAEQNLRDAQPHAGNEFPDSIDG